MLVEEVEAAAGEAALEQDRVLVVGPALDVGVLGQVGQDPAVADAGLDLGVQGPLVEDLADGLLEPVEPLAVGGADADRLVVVGLEDVEERAVGDPVDLVQDQDRRLIGQARAPRGPR